MLELKHLAPYLPYGITIRVFREGQSLFVEDILISGEMLDYLFENSEHRRHSRFIYKPILHPLSDLTKPITHNGETFVPIYELFKNYALREVDTTNLSDEFGCKMEDDTINLFCNGFLFGYDLLDNSFCFLLNEESLPVSNQLEMFEKLHEWHFDTKNLIGQGIAIDLNTVNKKQ